MKFSTVRISLQALCVFICWYSELRFFLCRVRAYAKCQNTKILLHISLEFRQREGKQCYTYPCTHSHTHIHCATNVGNISHGFYLLTIPTICALSINSIFDSRFVICDFMRGRHSFYASNICHSPSATHSRNTLPAFLPSHNKRADILCCLLFGKIY